MCRNHHNDVMRTMPHDTVTNDDMVMNRGAVHHMMDNHWVMHHDLCHRRHRHHHATGKQTSNQQTFHNPSSDELDPSMGPVV